MTNERPQYMVPALIGGAAAGLLSGVPIVNCLCCLWIIGGAMLSVHLLARDTPTSLTAGDGAILGALTGIAAAVVRSLIGLPLHNLNIQVLRRIMERMAEFAKDMPAGWDSLMQRASLEKLSLSGFILALFFDAAIFAVLGILGGVIGVSLFGKKKPPVPVPPSPPAPEGPHAV